MSYYIVKPFKYQYIFPIIKKEITLVQVNCYVSGYNKLCSVWQGGDWNHMYIIALIFSLFCSNYDIFETVCDLFTHIRRGRFTCIG